MRSWEYAKNIIAHFQSYPQIESISFSFFSTVISTDYKIYRNFSSSFENPEIKQDPLEILEEILDLFAAINLNSITIDLTTNVVFEKSERHKMIIQDYILPMLQILASHTDIAEIRESSLDILSLQGLYHNSQRKLIPEVVNTIIYV